MFVVKNLSKNLGGRPIIQNINFCLKKGEIIALVGKNGAGKTTLMRSMSGYYDLDEGEVNFNNVSLATNREAFLKKLAYVPETGGLYPEMSVYEYLCFMAQIKGIRIKKADSEIKKLSAELELDSVLAQKCETLSKGYKRRTAIAGAMISNPEMLILDEPTEGLDPQQKQHLRKFLLQYAAKGNIVLISTHIMEEVEALAERVLMIKDGHLICDTTQAELKKATPGESMEESFCTILKD